MLLFLALVACADKDAVDSSETAVVSDSGTPPAPPCDGGWGFITADPELAVHVRSDGDDTADGSAATPVASLEMAVELAKDKARPIAVGPGTFPTAVSLYGAAAGMSIQGCSPEETVLEASNPEAPVLDINGADMVSVAGFAVVGGNIGIKVWGEGADNFDASNILVDGSSAAGISVNGGVCSLTDIIIVNLTAADEGYGYGIASVGSTVSLTDVSVAGAISAGIVASGGSVDFNAVTVANTATLADGSLGRGVQLQQYTSGTVNGLTLDGNADAGLFTMRSAVSGSNLTITNTASAKCDGCEVDTGDAAVFTRGDENTDPSNYQISLTEVTIDQADRTGMLFSGVTATLGNVTATDCGHLVDEQALLSQDGAVVSGAEFATLDEVLPTNLTVLPIPG
jgi:hypothetical protein